MPLSQINNGDSGLTVRTTLNQVIDKTNLSGAQLLVSASVDLNLSSSLLPYPRLRWSGNGISNVNLTYSNLTGTFTIGELITDNDGNNGFAFIDSAGSMSLAYTGYATQNPFTSGNTITGQISSATATIDTSVSSSLLTPGESIISINGSSSADVVTSQTGSGVYENYSEITNVTGSFDVGVINFNSVFINPWVPGETINNITSGATATLIYTPSSTTLVLKDITGSFSSGDIVSGSISSNSDAINSDINFNPNYNVVIGQTSKVAFPIDAFYTSSYTDQPLTLTGGSKFLITDVVMTNGIGTYISASNPVITTQPYQGGDIIAQGASNMIGETAITFLLQSPDTYINSINNYNSVGISLLTNKTVGNNLYYANSFNESPATADLYIYGYILE